MTLPMILAPLFVLVLMTFALGFWLAALRAPAFSRGEVRAEDVDLRQPNWPRRTMQVGNSFSSQFELPMLFYVLTILAIITKHADFLFVVLAWIFVGGRVVHSWVQILTRNIRLRGLVFTINFLAVFGLWLCLLIRS